MAGDAWFEPVGNPADSRVTPEVTIIAAIKSRTFWKNRTFRAASIALAPAATYR